MKNYCLVSIFLLVNLGLFSQGVLITDDASTSPDASAMLEMKSTSKGFLPPRLDQSQIDALASPQAGMIVYNLTKKIPVCFNGTEWLDLAGNTVDTELAVGDYYQGGIIFYLDGLGGGAIAALADVSDGGDYTVIWGCVGTVTGATSATDGETNTVTILGNACSASNIAAYLAGNYTGDGYTDWYLPAINQLALMYTLRETIGGFATGFTDWGYWSSTEVSASNANYYYFYNGTSGSAAKGGGGIFQYRVRPIRTF